MTPAVLITGGAGFIGTNLAHRLLSRGRPVRLFDNLSREGVAANLRWLRATHQDRVDIEVADVRDRPALRRALMAVDQVFHFAAQVAVTTSLSDPVTDFDVNARGTLNLLEEIRALAEPPALVFTSTNKVYGHLGDLELERNGTRYYPADSVAAAFGISEKRSLAFHSPYGCSKGAAEQYVLDYARVYGIPATVFRMSCIYGPHQCGTEDQGWVAHFVLRALDERPITLYGDGMQVRDLLFVDDLLDAFLAAQQNMPRIAGRAFNIGGGPGSTASLLEMVDLIGRLNGRPPRVDFEPWRTADQRYYVSDIRAFQSATGWAPRTGVREGVGKLYEWMLESRSVTASRVLAGRVAP
jgi:CDP-paratose 2-epimerase